MVKNYLKNGQEADIAGHIVKIDDVPSVYAMIRSINNEKSNSKGYHMVSSVCTCNIGVLDRQ